MLKTQRPDVGGVGPKLEKRFIQRQPQSSSKAKSPKQGGRRSRDKGNRIERELVERHKTLGVYAERYRLSGASRFRNSSHDIGIYVLGSEAAPLVAEVKARASGERWLGDYDLLVLRRDHTDPLVLLPWRTWAVLLKRVRP